MNQNDEDWSDVRVRLKMSLGDAQRSRGWTDGEWQIVPLRQLQLIELNANLAAPTVRIAVLQSRGLVVDDRESCREYCCCRQPSWLPGTRRAALFCCDSRTAKDEYGCSRNLMRSGTLSQCRFSNSGV